MLCRLPYRWPILILCIKVMHIIACKPSPHQVSFSMLLFFQPKCNPFSTKTVHKTKISLFRDCRVQNCELHLVHVQIAFCTFLSTTFANGSYAFYILIETFIYNFQPLLLLFNYFYILLKHGPFSPHFISMSRLVKWWIVPSYPNDQSVIPLLCSDCICMYVCIHVQEI